MKKITALLIAIALVLSLCACGSTAPGNQTASEEASVTPEPTEKPETELEKLIREAGEGVPDALLGLARSKALHQGFPDRKATAGNLAFPFSPSDFAGGAVYEFALYHLTDLPLQFKPQIQVIE